MAGTVIPYERALPSVSSPSPYDKPTSYLEKLGAGEYAERDGRRPSDLFLVNKLREEVDAWRDGYYKDITPVTRRLFQYWFEDDHLLPNGQPWRYYWAQREAIETFVYLTEVRQFLDFIPLAEEFGARPVHGMLDMDFQFGTDRQGQRRLTRWVPEAGRDTTQDIPAQDLWRVAFKMATGSGKTVVMAMVVAWSYLNRTMGSPKPYYADNFLIVAPNVIVFERLEGDFDSNQIFHQLPIVPPEWKGQWALKVILRGESAMPGPGGNLFLVNIQQIYESREEEWRPLNSVDAILGREPKQDLAAYQPSMLERIKGLNNLMVLNDEAHHVHDAELAWNRTLLALNDNLTQKVGHGLTAWLDFSATPKTQAGTYFPWVIVDYPLAQAIEDHVVKAPLILHQLDKDDPQRVTATSVVEDYGDWIRVALERWRQHSETYQKLGQKSVLFVMTERTSYADKIGEYIRQVTGLTEKEVLVIHTDTSGEIYQYDLDIARKTAREIDDPANPVKVIVSVLMLREGWDVKNVTLILGLRPFTAKANILPEQAVGRGLRLMPNTGPDRQTLEVMGTRNFEDFVRELEHEGVGIDTVRTPPADPLIIYPMAERKAYDIAIPLTRPRYKHEYRNLRALDPLALEPIFEAGVLDEQSAIRIKLDFMTTDTTVHTATIAGTDRLARGDALRLITRRIASNLALSSRFAELFSLVKRYIEHRAFGQTVDLDDERVVARLQDSELQQAITSHLSHKIAHLSTVEREIEFENATYRLFDTKPFGWRRQHITARHTIFNACAVFNDLEARFATFLDGAPDILRFAALAETYTRFRVDYLSERGAIRFYYPDFIAIQETEAGETHWVIETKGREYENLEHKNRSIRNWCEKISEQTGEPWRFLIVRQRQFDKFQGTTFSGLLDHIEGAQLSL